MPDSDEIYDELNVEPEPENSELFNFNSEDLSYEMKFIYNEIDQELHEDFAEECDESMREAA